MLPSLIIDNGITRPFDPKTDARRLLDKLCNDLGICVIVENNPLPEFERYNDSVIICPSDRILIMGRDATPESINATIGFLTDNKTFAK